ncbi:glycosyltransferase [Leisingera sp. D0M16]|uniref:glycosyltransferase n=1 Tax=Leisingera coralii TaxID=3351347 RepID=UPI003B827D28
MFYTIRALFRRYAEAHLAVACRGFPLRDEAGRSLGYLDRYGIAQGRLYAIGWTTAERVALVSEGRRTVAVPELPRPDVARQLGTPDRPDTGFYAAQPVPDGRMLLSVEQDGHCYFHPLPPVPAARIRAARRRLLPRFLAELLRAAPAVLRWKLHRRPADRAAVKRSLRLSEEPGRDMAPSLPLFPDTGADPEPPGKLAEPQVTIVLPVHNAFDMLPEALERVVRHTDLPWHLVAVEDCSTDERVRPWLRGWAARQGTERVTLIENAVNRGFIGSVNRAFAAARARGNHVILLNSDAFVPENWASRLVRPLLAREDVASVTPMSNNAEIFTAPVICRPEELASGEADAVDRTARRFGPGAGPCEAPTGVGFCMALNIRFLEKLPEFDTGFGRGYGEEVDWCQRASALGGRHLGLPSLFVEHRGGSSFGSAEKLALIRRNSETVSRRYPDYDQAVQDFIRRDPLAAPRLALGLALAAPRAAGPVPVYLAHAMGGGAEKYLERRIAQDIAARGCALVLRVGTRHRWQLELHGDGGITRAVSEDFECVRQILALPAALEIVYSCGVGDRDPAGLPGCLLALKRGPQDRIEVLFHDFFPLSPSFNLLGQDRQFRGVPEAGSQEAVHTARRPGGARVALQEWRAEWGRLLQAADRVVAFSEDSRRHIAAAYPDLPRPVLVEPHALPAALPRMTPPPAAAPVIGVLGSIGYEKGAAVLAGLSHALDRTGGNPLVVIGNVDPSFPFSRSARIHGRYQFEELPELIRRYGVTHWLIPSICPETFSFATHEVLSTGMPVYCFGLGAQAEAVAKAPNGVVIALPEDRSSLPERILAEICGGAEGAPWPSVRKSA